MASSNTAELVLISSLPAAKIYKAYCLEFDNLAPKVSPQQFKSIETIQGDGGVGSVKHIKFAEAVPYKSVTQKVDVIDKDNFTYNFTMFEGDFLMGIFESINYHIKVEPSADGGSVFKQKVIFNCKSGHQVQDDHIKFGEESFTKVFQAIEAHVLANPHAY